MDNWCLERKRDSGELFRLIQQSEHQDAGKERLTPLILHHGDKTVRTQTNTTRQCQRRRYSSSLQSGHYIGKHAGLLAGRRRRLAGLATVSSRYLSHATLHKGCVAAIINFDSRADGSFIDCELVEPVGLSQKS